MLSFTTSNWMTLYELDPNDEDFDDRVQKLNFPQGNRQPELQGHVMRLGDFLLGFAQLL